MVECDLYTDQVRDEVVFDDVHHVAGSHINLSAVFHVRKVPCVSIQDLCIRNVRSMRETDKQAERYKNL